LRHSGFANTGEREAACEYARLVLDMDDWSRMLRRLWRIFSRWRAKRR
jgi:hypothetical protein